MNLPAGVEVTIWTEDFIGIDSLVDLWKRGGYGLGATGGKHENK